MRPTRTRGEPLSRKSRAAEQLPPQILADPAALTASELSRLKEKTPPSAPRRSRGADIGLDSEVVRDSRGRIGEADAAPTTARTLSRVGRPSLTGAGQHSPAVSFRVSAELRRLAEERAAAEGKTVSQLAREALERHVRGHA